VKRYPHPEAGLVRMVGCVGEREGTRPGWRMWSWKEGRMRRVGEKE